MKKLLTLSIATSMVAASAFAAGNTNTGCGLGSLVFPEQDTVAVQVLAATSNALGSQTFGITSGSLDCTKPYKLVMNEKAQRFVADNMDSIATEIASGEGENLDTLLSLINIQDKQKVSKSLKDNFASIYTNENVTSAQVLDNIASYI